MKFQKLFTATLMAGALAMGATSCKKDDNNNTTTPAESNVLQGNLTANKTLTAGTWTIKGYVYVQDGATLTIPAGTILKSDIVEKGAIIVERGAKIMAEGTAAQPIVFTSGQPAGQRRPGDWGGIILLGKATTNRSTEPTIEGGVGKQYGGTDDADNSGVMKYVRIEFAGIAAEPGSEINGLTFGGVGNGTTIENIMVSYGNDDAYEFFGGTVNCKNMIAFATSDDDFDFDYGYRGSITNAISFKHPQFADPGDASNGIEADNDGSGTSATPNTHPKLSYFTMVGPNDAKNTQANHNYGNRWRRNVEFDIEKSIIIGFQKGGFSLESAGTIDKYFVGTSKFANNLVHAVASPFKITAEGSNGETAADVETKAVADGCVNLASADDAGLTDPFNITAPNFMPKSGSQAATKGVGAIQGTDWTTGWSNWDPNNTTY